VQDCDSVLLQIKCVFDIIRSNRRTGVYRAESLSTRMSPLAGQYAGGAPASVASGSCSIVEYSWMRSILAQGCQSCAGCLLSRTPSTCLQRLPSH
jgi:hypothetical protein